MSEEKVGAELQDDSELSGAVENGSPLDENTGAEEPAVEAERDLEQELADAQQEVAELRDRMLRAAAENENFKKRVERERMTSLKYAGETIFREMLPVVDNLERAVGQGAVEGAPAEQNLAALLEGVQLTLNLVVSTLEKFEVKKIQSVGQPFDPNIQEALSMEASDVVPANHVVGEFEKGYRFKDRLLRAARVIVSSGPGAG